MEIQAGKKHHFKNSEILLNYFESTLEKNSYLKFWGFGGGTESVDDKQGIKKWTEMEL